MYNGHFPVEKNYTSLLHFQLAYVRMYVCIYVRVCVCMCVHACVCIALVHHQLLRCV